ncbi:MAG TPA: hypothetical protein VFN10_17550 [Thermoanaerobaculia bacterium]|nr:hypothetical protein [Thermoanaerobaculia bacterium]
MIAILPLLLAATLNAGDVVVVPEPNLAFPIAQFYPAELLSSDGALKAMLPEAGESASADGLLHLAIGYGPVATYDSSLNVVQQRAIDGDIAAGASNRIYAAHEDRIDVYDASGAIVQTLPAPAGRDFRQVDVARCYVFAFGDEWLTRFDVCRGTNEEFHVRANAVHGLRDGGFIALLVSRIDVYDPSGALLREIPSPPLQSPQSIAFAEDPHFVWLAGDGRVFKMRLSDGAVVASHPTGVIHDLTVIGEQRPERAVSLAVASNVSTLSSLASFALFATLAIAAAIAVRNR